MYRGVLNKTDVAIKVITSHDPEQQAKFVQEIVTLRACYNTNIVQVSTLIPYNISQAHAAWLGTG